MLVKSMWELLPRLDKFFLESYFLLLELVEAVGCLCEDVGDVGWELGCSCFRGINFEQLRLLQTLACDWALISGAQVLHDDRFLEHVSTGNMVRFEGLN